MARVPPHLLWPGMVLAFLGFTVATQAGLLMASRSGGGPQIEADYYRRSLQWDAQRALQASSADLGWHLQISSPVEVGGGQRRLEVSIEDALGAPVVGLEGKLEVRRPSKVGAFEVALRPVEGRPGVYSAQAPMGEPGLWDLTLCVERGAQVFLAVRRVDIGPSS